MDNGRVGFDGRLFNDVGGLLSHDVVAGLTRGHVTEGILVNMPAIVSSRSVACNYNIMTESSHHV